MAWYKEWFGQDYLDLYAHRDEPEAESHIDFVERALGGVEPRAVLDLACGAGRHTRVLRRRGHRALGVDLSVALLARGEALPRVAGDMCCLPFDDGVFDWVLNFFTSFGYFETEAANQQVLHEVARLLAPRGAFLVDLFNLEQVVADLMPSEEHAEGARRVRIERWYDATRRRVNKRIRVSEPGRPEKTYLESVRGYTEDEARAALDAAGLAVTGIYGSFDGDAYGSGSERLILVGRKRG